MTKITPTQDLVRAATLSRRRLLKSAVAIGAVGLAAPLTVENAFSSSGEVNFEGWSGYDDMPKVMDAFTKATGIKVNAKYVDEQDTMRADAKTASAAGTVDVIEPTVDRLPAWVDDGLIQAWDLKKSAPDNYLESVPGAKAGSAGDINGQRYFLPTVWGTEALTFNAKTKDGSYGKASLADLFDESNAGKVTVRGHSSLAAMGRVLDAQGKLPMPWIDGYKNEDNMKKLWDIALAEAVKHKKNIAQFWKGENDAQAAFKTNGAEIGLTWDSTGFNLRKDGYGFIAPKEGAFGWSQGLVLLKGAKNVEQAHEFAKWVSTADGAAAWASAFSANPVGKGAIEKMDPEVSAFYKKSYPGDALAKLYWWPPQSAWFLKLRGDYASKWLAS